MEERPVETRGPAVGVRFRPSGRVYDFDPGPLVLVRDDRVLVETERGPALGTVVALARPRPTARALQRYGMFLADGGNVPLTIAWDDFTKAKWSDLGVDSQALGALKATDFEVVEMGTPISGNNDCTRN